MEENKTTYVKKYYENNKEYYRAYYKEYYKMHKNHILETTKKWREENEKMDTVYFFINDEGENIYIGSTSIFNTRMSSHLNGCSNLKMSAENLVNDYNLSTILYKDFSECNLNREDLYCIEKMYKDEQGEILKGKQVHCNNEKLSMSIEELWELAESIPYKEFNKLDRYLS